MADHYTVTDEDGEYAESIPTKHPGESKWVGSLAWAMSSEDAASVWAARVHSEMEYPETMSCIVTDPDGAVERFDIRVEYNPNFYPTPREVADV